MKKKVKKNTLKTRKIVRIRDDATGQSTEIVEIPSFQFDNCAP